MSIKNAAISAVLGLMFLSLLTIYITSLPSPLITFLSVLIMLVGLIMAQRIEDSLFIGGQQFWLTHRRRR